jgi:hypothetical protein
MDHEVEEHLVVGHLVEEQKVDGVAFCGWDKRRRGIKWRYIRRRTYGERNNFWREKSRKIYKLIVRSEEA